MFVISPLSNCASPSSSDRFLDFISKIDVVTHKNEPGAIAYAWFRGADDNDAVPGHWLRGFEIYDTVDANQVAHRASDEYKAFRQAVGAESLLERPSDLRFWRPTGVGFFTRNSTPISFKDNGTHHVVIDQFTPNRGNKASILDALRAMASLATEDESVSSFWVLDRGEDSNSDDELFVFACYENKEAWSRFEARDVLNLWKEAKAGSHGWQRTSWKASGIGFIGR